LAVTDLGTRARGAPIDDDDARSAVLFRPVDDADRAALEQLRSSSSNVRVCDHLRVQLAGLIQSRTPDRRLSPPELHEAVLAHLGGVPENRYGVWAWYPWLGRLVHLLDREEFVELRTDRNQDKITRAERDRLAGARVGVVGISTGYAIALALAVERVCGELRVADHDRLELSNLNRLHAGVHQLGLRKVTVTSREIAEIDPFVDVVCFPEGITAANVDEFLVGGGRLDAVFEESDSLDVKLLLRERARAHRIPVLMATSDRGLFDVERFDLEPERPILHGLVGDLDSDRLGRFATTAEKVPIALAIMGGRDNLSERMLASLAQVGSRIETWPQLHSAVALGAATAADVCRRILLGQLVSSGRHVIDLDELVSD
jgi:hypothetical protein